MRISQVVHVCVLLFAGCLSVSAQAPRIVVNPLGHSAKIHKVLFTPDGQQIISVSEDKTIRVWNADTGAMIRKFESQIGEGPEGMFYAAALSPDGKLLAVGGYQVATESENYIIIIDLEKGSQVSTASGHTDVINSLSFSGSGKYLASGGADKLVKVWRIESAPKLTVVSSIPVPSPVSCLAFNTLTQDLAVAHESNDILIFGLASLDKGNAKIAPRILKRHKGNVDKVVYSTDGAYLATSSYENELIVWKPDGTVVKEFEDLVNPINAIAFSADSKIMAGLDVLGKGTSWGLPAGNKFADFKGHDNTVFSAAFAPSLHGNYVVASAGGINNEIILWNPINGLTVRRIKGKGNAVTDLSFSSGMKLSIAQERSKDNKPVYKTSFDFESLTIGRSPGGVTSGKESVKGISQTGPNTLDLPKSKKVQTDENQDGRILDYRALPDGSVIVASDFSLKLFDRNGYLNKEFIGHYGAVRSIAVSADGKYFASGGEDQSIILWKLSETGFAPSLRQTFAGDDWSSYFSSLPVDSLTKEPTKKAWNDVIAFLKKAGDKTYKGIEEVYKTLGEQVIPFATLFVTDDQEWICWTPKGYFSCSSSGGQYFGWHVNKGINQLADFYSAEQYFEILYRPTELSNSFKQGKRVEDLLRESGERIFDLSKLHRPSVGFFDVTVTTRATDLLRYDKGKFFTQARTIPLTVDIYDGGGGVKEVNIYQNDKLIISDKDVKTSGEGEKRSKTYAVEMVNERNEFRVKVMNFQKIESRSDELVIEYTGEVIATSTLHILAVGINKYKNESYNLNYAQPDAFSFVEKINERSKGIFKGVNRVEIYDEEATKENITTGFKAMIARAKPEDVFMFYYAGHGTLDEENNEEYYLVPTDITKLYGDPEQLHARGISATDIKNFLTQIKSQKQIILMDACHSGGAVKSLSTRGVASDEKAMVQLARSSGVVMIASSGTKQLATEFEALKHGVFTYALLEALDGKADNGDRKITVNELKFYMEDRVPELTKQYGGKAQYPTGYITGNDFPISVLDK
jgi:WD40 repeat protein